MMARPDRLDQTFSEPPARQPNLVTIIGGLGNQLFQYAFGQFLEARTGRPTRYDLSLLANYKLHGSSLAIEKVFDVKIAAATAAELQCRPWVARDPDRLKIAARLSRWQLPAIPISTDYSVEPADFLGDLPPRLYHGYWQRPDYAVDVAARLALRPDVLAAAEAIMAAQGLDPVRDVAVHVRRGDYLTLPNACHLPLSEADYYAPLLRGLAAAGRRFVVLSDDIGPLRDGPLAQFDTVFVDQGMSPSVAVDFCLLSRFRTIVMSASSFSWWAAVLSPHADGVVLCPSPWVKLPFVGDRAMTAKPLSNWKLIDARESPAAEGRHSARQHTTGSR